MDASRSSSDRPTERTDMTKFDPIAEAFLAEMRRNRDEDQQDNTEAAPGTEEE